MDVSKLPAAAVVQNQASSPGNDQGAQAPAAVPAPGDRAEIRPDDVPGALQILIAEVRLALVTVLEAALDTAPGGVMRSAAVSALTPAAENAAHAAHGVVEMLLQSIPDAADGVPDDGAVAVWAAAAAQVEAAVQQGFDDALRTVSNWHAVAATVVDAPRDARALTAAVLGDEMPNPLWLRPEWVGLAPRLARYVRRRRYARRRLSDPDFSRRGLDDADWE